MKSVSSLSATPSSIQNCVIYQPTTLKRLYGALDWWITVSALWFLLPGVQQKYIIVTCNYVARGRGVTKLMGVKEALEKCPDLVLVKGEDLTHYREISYRVTGALLLHCYTSLGPPPCISTHCPLHQLH